MLESFVFFEFFEHMQVSCHASTEMTEFFEHMQVSWRCSTRNLDMLEKLKKTQKFWEMPGLHQVDARIF